MEIRAIQPGVWVDLGNGLEVRHDEPRARTIELFGGRIKVEGEWGVRPSPVQRQPVVRRSDPFGPAVMPAVRSGFGPSVTARFDGLCNACDDEIETGDPIRVGPEGSVHEGCATEQAPGDQSELY